jgi:GH43 family beta-xylosidase
MEEVTLEWRKQNTEELNDLYWSPNIIRMIKSRRKRYVRNVVHMKERKGGYRVLVGKLEGKTPLGGPGVDGKIISRWIFRKWDVGTWTESSWLRIRTGGGHLWM